MTPTWDAGKAMNAPGDLRGPVNRTGTDADRFPPGCPGAQSFEQMVTDPQRVGHGRQGRVHRSDARG